MKYRHSAGNKKIFEEYVKNRFKGWKIKSIKTIKKSMKTFPGEYEAILVKKPIKKIRVFNYGEWSEYDNLDQAKKEYLEAMKNSEGSERERYKTIYSQLQKGLTTVSDGVE